MKKLLSTRSDVKEVFHSDAHDDTHYIEQIQDVTPYLKRAHEARAARGEHTRYQSEVLNLKCSIPETVALKWCRDKGIKYQSFLADEKVMKMFLNDPDNKSFMLIPGKV